MSDREGNASPYSVGSIPTAKIDGCRQSASDLKQMAVVVAAFVYNTAQMEEKIPRKELPKAGRR